MQNDSRADWFVLEGEISHFQWAEGSENLLEQIQQRSKLKNAAAGAAAAALGLYGTLATSSMIATYDGEYTENFACSVAGRVVCGSFSGARKLKNGDAVKLVVRPLENEVLQVIAVMRSKDELLWLPSLGFWGANAALKESIRSIRNMTVVSCAVLTIISFLGYLFGGFSLNFCLFLVLLSVVGTPLMGFAGEFLPTRVTKEFGDTGSKIFSLLSFPDADNINMQRAGLSYQTDEEQVDNVYMYRLALDANGTNTKIITKSDRNIARYKQEAEAKKASK
jgi:hypothetical protein